VNAINLQPQGGDKVLLLIDWENVFYTLFADFGPDKMNLDLRFKKLMAWIKEELGKLLGECGFIFAPEHFTTYHREICIQNNLKIMICPKRQIENGEEDTVDETIIWFGKMMMEHPEVKFLCLVSGDEDYVPLLQEAEKNSIHIALVVPTLNALSTNKRIVNFIGYHPKTKKKMVFRLDQV